MKTRKKWRAWWKIQFFGCWLTLTCRPVLMGLDRQCQHQRRILYLHSNLFIYIWLMSMVAVNGWHRSLHFSGLHFSSRPKWIWSIVGQFFYIFYLWYGIKINVEPLVELKGTLGLKHKNTGFHFDWSCWSFVIHFLWSFLYFRILHINSIHKLCRYISNPMKDFFWDLLET